MLELRPYRPQDFERLLEIDQLCFTPGIAYTGRELRYFLSLPLAITLVAEEGGTIYGFVTADRLCRPRAAPIMGRIITIDVTPGRQRAGTGSWLLTSVENALQEAGCGSVTLEVAVDNQPALRFYKKHAYTVLKSLPRYYLNSIDGLMMGKRL